MNSGHHKFHENSSNFSSVSILLAVFLFIYFLLVGWFCFWFFICLAWKSYGSVMLILMEDYGYLFELLNQYSHISIWRRYITLLVYQLLWPDLTFCFQKQVLTCGCKVSWSSFSRTLRKKNCQKSKTSGNDYAFSVLPLVKNLWDATLITSLLYTCLLSLLD